MSWSTIQEILNEPQQQSGLASSAWLKIHMLHTATDLTEEDIATLNYQNLLAALMELTEEPIVVGVNSTQWLQISD